MPWEHIAYAFLVGWAAAWWVYRVGWYAGGVADGHPDGGCPECGVVIGAIGATVIIYLLGGSLGHDIGAMTLTGAAGAIFVTSAYRMVVGRGRRGAAAGQSTGR